MVSSEFQEQEDSVVEVERVGFSEYGPEPPQEAVLMACPALLAVRDLLAVRVVVYLVFQGLAVVRVVRLGLRNDLVVALLLLRGERYTGHLGFFACMIYRQFAHDMTLR